MPSIPVAEKVKSKRISIQPGEEGHHWVNQR
jgi:hypothetical protein